MPNGIYFSTPSAPEAKNIVFTSQWDNYPHDVTIPLNGHANHAYFYGGLDEFHAKSHGQRRSGGHVYRRQFSAMALRNPETWWPIDQDYFIDDYQFPLEGALPPRVDLRTGNIRLLNLATFKGEGRTVPGGAATVLDLALDPKKQLQSLTVRTLCNDVVIGADERHAGTALTSRRESSLYLLVLDAICF